MLAAPQHQTHIEAHVETHAAEEAAAKRAQLLAAAAR
jgi:hypothetical protein